MWKRNLLFLGLIAVGMVALGANLYPAMRTPEVKHFDTAALQANDFRSVVNEVNTAFRQEWHEAELPASPKAPDLAILRRLNLALVGAAPSVEEIRQFEAYDGPERFEWWVARLLEDRRFADNFAERFARTYVGTEDGPFLIYRRRRFVTWLSDQFIQNTPYDKIVRELIASQGLWTEKPATNFVTVTIANDKPPDRERLAGRVTRAFLGLRLDCAQCHDHPFQHWKQADFQGLAAFFGQTDKSFTGIKDGDGEYESENRKTLKKEKVNPCVPFNAELRPKEGTRREQLAAWVTSAQNPYFAQATVNRVWALMFNRALVEPVDDLGTATVQPKALGMLANDFAAHGFDVQRLVRIIVATDVFQLDSAAEHEITDAHEKAWAAFPLTRLRPDQVIGSVLQSSTLATLDAESHIFLRTLRLINSNDFVKRYGDTGEDELDSRGGTIPQRLLLMNGNVVHDRIKDGFLNASTRIAQLAPTDEKAIETAFLAILTRRPTDAEMKEFLQDLQGTSGGERHRRMEDLYWTLINVTEFSWNH